MNYSDRFRVTLIKNAHVLDPADQGKNNVLVIGDKIVYIGESEVELPFYLESVAEEVDLEGNFLVPGIIDGHVHILGGGGEGGPITRTPEITLTKLTLNGVSTVVGVLGTDSTTRNLQSLVAKARALQEEGLTTYIYTGAYQIPTPTITGTVRDDITLIDKVIGSKLAISDHRSSQPTAQQIKYLASECRVGGMMGSKPGLLHVHIGSQSEGLQPLFDVVNSTDIPASQMYPTHVSRNKELLDQAAEYTKIGGAVDVTAGSSAPEAIIYLKELGADMSNVTVSSDGNGSLPRFNEDGEFIGLGVGSPGTLLETLRTLVNENVMEIGEILPLLTTNPANHLDLQNKGELVSGKDADMVCLEKETLQLKHLWAKGALMVKESTPTVSGTFE